MVRQRELPVGLEDTLLQELSSHSHIRELLRLMETAIRFLATGAGASASASASSNAAKGGLEEVPIGTLFTEIMGTSKATWDQSSTPTMRSAFVTTALLSQLFVVVERGLGVEPFSRVAPKYRVPLPPHLQSLVTARIIRAPKSGFQWREIIPLLAAVLTDNLSDSVAIRGDASLKDDLLIFIAGFDEVRGFEEHFPVEIKIEHCYSLYETLSASAVGGGGGMALTIHRL
jgi:hypothetical protein